MAEIIAYLYLSGVFCLLIVGLVSMIIAVVLSFIDMVLRYFGMPAHTLDSVNSICNYQIIYPVVYVLVLIWTVYSDAFGFRSGKNPKGKTTPISKYPSKRSQNSSRPQVSPNPFDVDALTSEVAAKTGALEFLGTPPPTTSKGTARQTSHPIVQPRIQLPPINKDRWISGIVGAVIGVLVGSIGTVATINYKPPAPESTKSAKEILQEILHDARSSVPSRTVYVTRTGKKYHHSGCNSLSKSQIPITLDDAERDGYTACSRCF